MATRNVVLATASAAVGYLMLGWDNGVIAGAMLYIVPDFKLETHPQLQGSIVAVMLLGGLLLTAVSGPLSDWLGRRPLLFIAGGLFCSGVLITTQAPNAYVLVAGRGLIGAGVGIITTVVPLYIAECAPPDARGVLASFPQLFCSGGLLISFVAAFFVTTSVHPDWRFLLSLSFIPGLSYFVLIAFLVPESPKWLASKGKMLETRNVLRYLRQTDDVADELILAVEGLAPPNGTATVEEWLLTPTDMDDDLVDEEEEEEGEAVRFIDVPNSEFYAYPLPPQNEYGCEGAGDVDTVGEGGVGGGLPSHPFSPSLEDRIPLLSASHSRTSLSGLAASSSAQGLPPLPPLPIVEQHLAKIRTSRLASQSMRDLGELQDGATPFAASSPSRAMFFDGPSRRLSMGPGASPRPSTPTSPFVQGGGNIGGGWRMAWNLEEPGMFRSPSTMSVAQAQQHEEHGLAGAQDTCAVQSEETSSVMPRLTRVFLLPESAVGFDGRTGSRVGSRVGSRAGTPRGKVFGAAGGVNEKDLERDELASTGWTGTPRKGGNFVRASVLVSESPALTGKVVLGGEEITMEGPAMAHPSMMESNFTSAFRDLLEPGVLQALVVGMGLQYFQQASGINAVLYFTPLIISDAGGDVFTPAGLSSASTAILASAACCVLLVPSVATAASLMDRAGRRPLLLSTLPVLILSLLGLSMAAQFFDPGLTRAIITIVCCGLVTSSYMMGIGPIAIIMCSEIFPTRVRGICIGICTVVQWLVNFVVCQSFPLLRLSVGLPIVFAVYAVITIMGWVFIYFKVPETKGLPLEIISEFFAIAARSTAAEEPTSEKAGKKYDDLC